MTDAMLPRSSGKFVNSETTNHVWDCHHWNKNATPSTCNVMVYGGVIEIHEMQDTMSYVIRTSNLCRDAKEKPSNCEETHSEQTSPWCRRGAQPGDHHNGPTHNKRSEYTKSTITFNIHPNHERKEFNGKYNQQQNTRRPNNPTKPEALNQTNKQQ